MTSDTMQLVAAYGFVGVIIAGIRGESGLSARGQIATALFWPLLALWFAGLGIREALKRQDR